MNRRPYHRLTLAVPTCAIAFLPALHVLSAFVNTFYSA